MPFGTMIGLFSTVDAYDDLYFHSQIDTILELTEITNAWTDEWIAEMRKNPPKVEIMLCTYVPETLVERPVPTYEEERKKHESELEVRLQVVKAVLGYTPLPIHDALNSSPVIRVLEITGSKFTAGWKEFLHAFAQAQHLWMLSIDDLNIPDEYIWDGPQLKQNQLKNAHDAFWYELGRTIACHPSLIALHCRVSNWGIVENDHSPFIYGLMPNRLLAIHIHVLEFQFFSEECIAALIETNTSLLDLRVAHVEFPMAEELDSPDPDVRERFKKRFVKNPYNRTFLQGRTRNRVERALRQNTTLRNLELNFDRDFERRANQRYGLDSDVALARVDRRLHPRACRIPGPISHTWDQLPPEMWSSVLAFFGVDDLCEPLLVQDVRSGFFIPHASAPMCKLASIIEGAFRYDAWTSAMKR